MRNPLCKLKKCELRHSLCHNKLSLKLIYVNEVNIDKLQLNMNSYGI